MSWGQTLIIPYHSHSAEVFSLPPPSKHYHEPISYDGFSLFGFTNYLPIDPNDNEMCIYTTQQFLPLLHFVFSSKSLLVIFKGNLFSFSNLYELLGDKWFQVHPTKYFFR